MRLNYVRGCTIVVALATLLCPFLRADPAAAPATQPAPVVESPKALTAISEALQRNGITISNLRAFEADPSPINNTVVIGRADVAQVDKLVAAFGLHEEKAAATQPTPGMPMSGAGMFGTERQTLRRILGNEARMLPGEAGVRWFSSSATPTKSGPAWVLRLADGGKIYALDAYYEPTSKDIVFFFMYLER